jgi:ATP-dependent RNA helicase HelY
MHAYTTDMTCHLGNFEEYFALRVAIADRERSLARQGSAQKRAAAVESVERLRIGDVIRVPHGRRAGLAVVLDTGATGFGEPRPLVLTEDRWAGRISSGDFGEPVKPLARVRVPKHFNHRSPQERRDLSAALRAATSDVAPARRAGRSRSAAADDTELARLRERMRQHPCHACPDRDEHARWAERRWRLGRETEALQAKVASRTGSLARTFDRVCELLTARGYLAADGEVTPYGRMLARIWTEADLLVAECLRQGVWDRLDPAELAAAVSVVLYEARRESEDRPSVPRGALTEAVDATLKLWADLESAESAHGLQLTREPDLGFVWPTYRWARGESLSKVLASAHGIEGDMPAGDFVRWERQVIDLLGQLAQATGVSAEIRKTARQAIAAVNRGVLAYTATT